MKRFILTFMMIAVAAVGVTYASGDTDGKNVKNEIPEFNLNADLVKVAIRPECGSGGDSGWAFQYYTYSTFRVTRIDKRDCTNSEGQADTETREVEMPVE